MIYFLADATTAGMHIFRTGVENGVSAREYNGESHTSENQLLVPNYFA